MVAVDVCKDILTILIGGGKRCSPCEALSHYAAVVLVSKTHTCCILNIMCVSGAKRKEQRADWEWGCI